MAKFKVVEHYPQASVRIVYVVEAESEEEIQEWGAMELCDASIKPEFYDIDWGGEAYTESVEAIQ